MLSNCIFDFHQHISQPLHIIIHPICKHQIKTTLVLVCHTDTNNIIKELRQESQSNLIHAFISQYQCQNDTQS